MFNSFGFLTPCTFCFQLSRHYDTLNPSRASTLGETHLRPSIHRVFKPQGGLGFRVCSHPNSEKCTHQGHLRVAPVDELHSPGSPLPSAAGAALGIRSGFYYTYIYWDRCSAKKSQDLHDLLSLGGGDRLG